MSRSLFFQHSGYDGKHVMLSFMPKKWQARYIARAWLGTLGAVDLTKTSCYITMSFGTFRILDAHGNVEPCAAHPHSNDFSSVPCKPKRANANEIVNEAVSAAKQYSDMTEEGLRFVGQSFYQAHCDNRNGLSIEIGTRCGGSALMQLLILKAMYEKPPPLFTVDPYGFKTYHGGDGDAVLYGDSEYVEMKKLLAEFPNHIHWYLERICFSHSNLEYWWSGQKRRIENATFILLDGDHDADTIAAELAWAKTVLAPKGVLVIDNVDKDENTLQLFRNYKYCRSPVKDKGASQIRIIKE